MNTRSNTGESTSHSGSQSTTNSLSDSLTHLMLDVRTWGNKAQQAHWLDDADVVEFETADARTPSSLFDSVERPLVVAFFGGTGVGKSTLLNRIAGADIARTSAERPTSREITLYLHSSNTIKQLPDDFPVDKINQATHDNDKHRSVLWIDMPDFDSAETANRGLVNDWLPHIDMLVYVVSPERYRDDQGWRLLLQHGQRHAWVFVINHWDRGNQDQRLAFKNIISEAGLQDPMIFCTDCGPPVDKTTGVDKPNGDEFEAFDSAVQKMASNLIISQLEERGILVRIQQSREQVHRARAKLGNDNALPGLNEQWQTDWQQTSNDIVSTLDWTFKQQSQPFAEHDKGFFSSLLDAIRRKKPDADQGLPNVLPRIDVDNLIDETTYTRIGVALDSLHQQASGHGLPTAPLRVVSAELATRVSDKFRAHLQPSVDRSIAQPGTPLQRRACQVLGVLATVLPLLAAGWAIFKLVTVYAGDQQSGQSYLGFNFATHSLLMIGFGWFVPWFLKQRIRPRLAAAARRGMRQGTEQALQSIADDVSGELDTLATQRQQLLEESEALFSNTPLLRGPEHHNPEFDAGLSADLSHDLKRVLLQEPAG